MEATLSIKWSLTERVPVKTGKKWIRETYATTSKISFFKSTIDF